MQKRALRLEEASHGWLRKHCAMRAEGWRVSLAELPGAEGRIRG